MVRGKNSFSFRVLVKLRFRPTSSSGEKWYLQALYVCGHIRNHKIMKLRILFHLGFCPKPRERR